MGTISIPDPVKLICGVLYSDPKQWREAEEHLQQRFGPIDFQSEVFPFQETDYYDREMGMGLSRMYVSFENLVSPDFLPEAKIYTNEVEADLADEHGNRRVNLDPGTVSGSNLILASAKGFYHRVYLRDGIYAEVTLFYREGRFRELPWTYPDYKNHREVLEEIRRVYLRQMKERRRQA